MKYTPKTKQRVLLAALTVLPCTFGQAQEEKEADRNQCRRMVTGTRLSDPGAYDVNGSPKDIERFPRCLMLVYRGCGTDH